MAKKRRAALLRTTAAAMVIASATVAPPIVRAQDEGSPFPAQQEDPFSRVPETSDEPIVLPPGTTLVVDGGTQSTDTTAFVGADAGASNADGSGGDMNVASGGGASLASDNGGDAANGGTYVDAGNGGYAESDASGGTFYSPLDENGNPIPILDSGGNAGSTITVDEVQAGSGNTLIEIYGGDQAIETDVSFYVTGGESNADASGGDRNVAIATGRGQTTSSRTVSAGNGGSASSSASGGYAPIGTILGGRNQGSVINVGEIIGGSGPGGGDVHVRIDGGTMNVTTVSTHHVAQGGYSEANAPGGSANVATIRGIGLLAASGNGGSADAEADGGMATIGVVRGELFSQVGGWNRGSTIQLGRVVGGDGTTGGMGGDTSVDIYGGDLTASGTSNDNPAYAGMNVGSSINVLQVAAGDGSEGGIGGDATLYVDAGSIAALASSPTGADAGDNVGSRILVTNVLGGDGVAGNGGDATVALEASDIVAAGTGFTVSAPEGAAPIPGAARGSSSAASGNGGSAGADANAGSASTGQVIAGDNRGTTMLVNDTLGGDGIGGVGGDATVVVSAADITAWFTAGANVDGGIAGASATGGLFNEAVLSGTGSSAAGTGGAANSSATGGLIQIGDIYLGGNDGGIVNIGQTTGGAGINGGEGGDASVWLDGGSITSIVQLDLEAKGGEAQTEANGGANNRSLLIGDGTDIGALAGTGGSAEANSNGGLIQIGRIEIGENSGGEMKVGNTTGGSGVNGGVGGDATLYVQGTDIVNLVSLQLEANGGFALATANGGSDNLATLIGTGDDGARVLSGAGGSATANANGGYIGIGSIVAGKNVGTVVKFGDITGGDAGAGQTGASDVSLRFGGKLLVTTVAALQSNGGWSTSGADGGSSNLAELKGDGTTGSGTPAVGSGGRSVSEANGGPITLDRITSGRNEGTSFNEKNRDTREGELAAYSLQPEQPVLADGSRSSRGASSAPETGRGARDVGAGGTAAKGAASTTPGVQDAPAASTRAAKPGKGSRQGAGIVALPATGDSSSLATTGAVAAILASIGAGMAALRGRRSRY